MTLSSTQPVARSPTTADPMHQPRFAQRYDSVTNEKAGGAVYTPRLLADFVSRKIVEAVRDVPTSGPLRLLDPAIGHGELLLSLLKHIPSDWQGPIQVCGFETDTDALEVAKKRVEQEFPAVSTHFEATNFLEFVLTHFEIGGCRDLFRTVNPELYDLIIANPPYVRTQVLGAQRAQLLSEQFGLSGRVDLYHAFVLGMSHVLKPQGVAGVIVSNRFMTTKSGESIRSALLERFEVRHAWDLGDTKLFEAAVLPAVLLLEGKNGTDPASSSFTTIYETSANATATAEDSIAALNEAGVVEIHDGRRFHVQHGKLDTSGKSNGVWRVATRTSDAWLKNVESHSWGTFRDVGKVRVGVKTCADRIFIRNDWQDMPEDDRPELLRPLATHHIARRFKPLSSDQPRSILYPHEVVQGRRRAVHLSDYPRAQAYLDAKRSTLEGRKYLIDAGREWYEIWVPQDPDVWARPKLVFRDIADEPTFWLDLDGSVVNGDCYWLANQRSSETDLLWLAAAVGNSTFAERFYDLRFNNKLYAGRRRFITQYVEKFPLPDPHDSLSGTIVATAKQIHDCTPSLASTRLQRDLDDLIWKALTG